MRGPAGWPGILATRVVLALLLASVLVFPRLLHPPLSPAQLQGVASPDKRVELQQAQAKLQNDARATLLQGVAGLLLVAGHRDLAAGPGQPGRADHRAVLPGD